MCSEASLEERMRVKNNLYTFSTSNESLILLIIVYVASI